MDKRIIDHILANGVIRISAPNNVKSMTLSGPHIFGPTETGERDAGWSGSVSSVGTEVRSAWWGEEAQARASTLI